MLTRVPPKEYDRAMEVEAINPNKEYTLKEIRNLRLVPWALHYQTLKKIIVDDFMGENMLQAIRKGEGVRTRYQIRGSRLIKYINQYAQALMRPVQTKKQCQQKQRRK